MNMDGRELYSIAREFLDKEFDMKLDIPIFISNRMKTMFGYFQRRNNVSWKIQMSQEFIETHPREHVIDVLKHELVHYALFEQGKPFRDGQQYFEDTLKRLGICSTRTYEALGKFHKYICNCDEAIYRKRRLPYGAICTKCRTLEYVGVVERSISK
jgi:SprT-like protein